MTAGYVLSAADTGQDTGGGSVRPTLGPATGSAHLEQALIVCAPGTGAVRATGDAEEVLFLVAGAGTLTAGDERHHVGPRSGAAIAPGREYALDAGPDGLEAVAVRLPAPGTTAGAAPAVVVVPPESQASGSATADRSFRLVCGPGAGCASATQFIGWIPPGRAPEHYHHYDEVIYVLEGEGVLHLAEGSTPVARGSCIHLPPTLRHSLENTGRAPLQVLGVFRPAGSPSEAYYPDGTPASSAPGGDVR